MNRKNLISWYRQQGIEPWILKLARKIYREANGEKDFDVCIEQAKKAVFTEKHKKRVNGAIDEILSDWKNKRPQSNKNNDNQTVT
jgi:hypothetical protein